jgi:hypothetical protein
LKDAKGDLVVFAGLGLDLRVVGLNDNVRLTFKRSWSLVAILDAAEEIDSDGGEKSDTDLVLRSIRSAVSARRMEREVVSVEVKGK